MKPYFLDMLTASRAFLPTMPSLESLEVALDKTWLQEAATQPPTSPVLVCLPTLPASFAPKISPPCLNARSLPQGGATVRIAAIGPWICRWADSLAWKEAVPKPTSFVNWRGV